MTSGEQFLGGGQSDDQILEGIYRVIETLDGNYAPDFHAGGINESQAILGQRVERVRERLKSGEAVLSLLVEQLTDSIKEGRWSSLLIEGRSAWLPGQVVSGIMRRHAEERGLLAPPALTVAGNRDPKYAQEGTEEARGLLTHLEQLRPSLGERTLVFTEYIQMGWSIAGVARALSKAGAAFDIAAIEADFLANDYLENFADYLSPDVQILVGSDNLLYGESLRTPAFYDGQEPDLQLASGLEREGTRLVEARQVPDALIRAAYEEARALEERLYNRYFN